MSFEEALANGWLLRDSSDAVKFISGDPRLDDGAFARQFAQSLAPSVNEFAVEYRLQNCVEP